MARTKQTLGCDPTKPPKDLLCGYCGFGHRHGCRSMLFTLKECCICNTPHPVHTKCAKIFFKFQAKKKNEIYDDGKFLNARFKFYCYKCKTSLCVICNREHPFGTPQSYIAECSAKHWYVCNEKCAPSEECKTTAKSTWFCPLHKPETVVAASKDDLSDKKHSTVSKVSSVEEYSKLLPNTDKAIVSSSLSSSELTTLKPTSTTLADTVIKSSKNEISTSFKTEKTSNNDEMTVSEGKSMVTAPFISKEPIKMKSLIDTIPKKDSNQIPDTRASTEKQTSDKNNNLSSDENDDEVSLHPKLKFYDLKKDIDLGQNQMVRRWTTTKRKVYLSMIENKNWPKNTKHKILSEFETKILPLSNLYNDKSEEQKSRNSSI